MGSVFVVGSVHQDYVLVVDHRPGAGETVTGATLALRCGGKGANQAVAAAAWGATVSLLARVGDDAAAAIQRRDLMARGVDVSLVRETTGAATGSAFITVTPDGENAVTVAPGANGLLRASDIDGAAHLIAASAVLVAQLEVPLAAVAEAIERCGPHTPVLLNAAPPAPLPRSLLERVDTLVVNEHEAASLVGAPVVGVSGAHEAAAALRHGGPRTVVVTLGSLGAVVDQPGGSTHVRAPSVDVVDTTGAGDVFVGTLAAVLADQQPLDGAVVIAVERASASVASSGARSPLAATPDSRRRRRRRR
jgi:ribokinase